MSLKSIAVPTRNAVKKRDSDKAAAPPYVPAVSAGSVQRTAQRHQMHRFTVGQRLSMAPGGRDISRGASTCSVIMVLPYEGGPLRYRVRSDNETYERIVEEKDLSPLPDDAE